MLVIFTVAATLATTVAATVDLNERLACAQGKYSGYLYYDLSEQTIQQVNYRFANTGQIYLLNQYAQQQREIACLKSLQYYNTYANKMEMLSIKSPIYQSERLNLNMFKRIFNGTHYADPTTLMGAIKAGYNRHFIEAIASFQIGFCVELDVNNNCINRMVLNCPKLDFYFNIYITTTGAVLGNIKCNFVGLHTPFFVKDNKSTGITILSSGTGTAPKGELHNRRYYIPEGALPMEESGYSKWKISYSSPWMEHLNHCPNNNIYSASAMAVGMESLTAYVVGTTKTGYELITYDSRLISTGCIKNKQANKSRDSGGVIKCNKHKLVIINGPELSSWQAGGGLDNATFNCLTKACSQNYGNTWSMDLTGSIADIEKLVISNGCKQFNVNPAVLECNSVKYTQPINLTLGRMCVMPTTKLGIEISKSSVFVPLSAVAKNLLIDKISDTILAAMADMEAVDSDVGVVGLLTLTITVIIGICTYNAVEAAKTVANIMVNNSSAVFQKLCGVIMLIVVVMALVISPAYLLWNALLLAGNSKSYRATATEVYPIDEGAIHAIGTLVGTLVYRPRNFFVNCVTCIALIAISFWWGCNQLKRVIKVPSPISTLSK